MLRDYAKSRALISSRPHALANAGKRSSRARKRPLLRNISLRCNSPCIAVGTPDDLEKVSFQLKIPARIKVHGRGNDETYPRRRSSSSTARRQVHTNSPARTRSKSPAPQPRSPRRSALSRVSSFDSEKSPVSVLMIDSLDALRPSSAEASPKPKLSENERTSLINQLSRRKSMDHDVNISTRQATIRPLRKTGGLSRKASSRSLKSNGSKGSLKSAHSKSRSSKVTKTKRKTNSLSSEEKKERRKRKLEKARQKEERRRAKEERHRVKEAKKKLKKLAKEKTKLRKKIEISELPSSVGKRVPEKRVQRWHTLPEPLHAVGEANKIESTKGVEKSQPKRNESIEVHSSKPLSLHSPIDMMISTSNSAEHRVKPSSSAAVPSKQRKPRKVRNPPAESKRKEPEPQKCIVDSCVPDRVPSTMVSIDPTDKPISTTNTADAKVKPSSTAPSIQQKMWSPQTKAKSKKDESHACPVRLYSQAEPTEKRQDRPSSTVVSIKDRIAMLGLN